MRTVCTDNNRRNNNRRNNNSSSARRCGTGTFRAEAHGRCRRRRGAIPADAIARALSPMRITS
ncbi:MAG: hypothetical protein MHM6MM_009146, partial [Cercozoa sp. M6MM]